ncbi:MAG: septum formation initiator family protein [Spirochaetaceae bacterium]|nr:septum formation initiator family protein [Spirochaetaceae bacterium]
MKILLALCAGTAVYVFISLLVGQDGFIAAKQMTSQQQLISARVSKLEAIHDSLQIEYTALQSDPEVIASYARKLGFVGADERLIKVTGLPSRETLVYDQGTVFKRDAVVALPEWICKVAGIIVGCLSLISSLLLELAHERASRRVHGFTHLSLADGAASLGQAELHTA